MEIKEQKYYDDYLGLVLYCVRKHIQQSYISNYDMIQAGYLGISKALQSYDTTKNVPLKLWLYRFINSEIIKARYKNNKERPESPISNITEITYNIPDTTDIPYNNIIAKEDVIERNTKIKNIKKVIQSRLKYFTKDNYLNRNIYIDRYFKSMSIKTIAKNYNISVSNVTKRISITTKYIQEKLNATTQ